VKSLGATHTIDYNSEDVVAEVKKLTDGFGVDAWIDLVGEATAKQGL